MMIRRRNLVVVVSAALAGCAGARKPIPANARITVPTTWRLPASSGTATLQSEWWQLFDDSTLQALVVEALGNNADVAVAAARVSEARADLDTAQANRLPTVQGALEGGRNRDVNPGFGVAEEQTAGRAMVQVSFDTDLFGRLKAASAAARSALLATDYAQQTVRLAVATLAASSYFNLLALDARLSIVRDTLRVRGTEMRLAQRRLDAGYASALDLVRAQAEVEATAQLIPTLELDIAKSENSLSILIGRPPGPVTRGVSLEQHPWPVVPVTLPSTLVRSRPDIAAAEASLAATDKQLDVARADFLPDIRLAASGGFIGSTLVDASPLGIWSLGTSILTPLYDVGHLRARQDAAGARRDAAAFAYRKTVLQAFREVEDNMAAIAKYRQKVDALTHQREFLAHAFTLASRRYREGYVNYLDQLDAQRNLLTSDLALVQARLDRYNAAISLIQALGGGWSRQDG